LPTGTEAAAGGRDPPPTPRHLGLRGEWRHTMERRRRDLASSQVG